MDATRIRVAGLAVVALGAALTIVGAGSGSGASAPPTPPVFAAVNSNSSVTSTVELRSVATGRVVEVLGRFGSSFTNNGFAFSPDGREVYFTLVPKRKNFNSLLLEQLTVTTRSRRFIGLGEQPALSPDGGLLAYVSGGNRSSTIVIRDLASGQQRSLNLARLLGSKVDMLNALLAWVGGGTQVALFEACCAIPAARANADRGSGLHLVAVSVPRHGRLSARQVALARGTEMPETVGPDTAGPNSLMVSQLIDRDRATVDRLTIGASRAVLARVLTIAHAQVTAFDPSGQRLLYLVGHSPPSLWTATLSDRQLTQRHLLIRNPPLDPYAW